MDSKELLATFRKMPENKQNKIIIASFRQVADTHTLGLSLDHFTWRDCTLDDGQLRFNVGRTAHLTPCAEERNLTDYAAVIYCLATGKSSSESMGWDAGRKIDSAVLREIVLTLNGRNYATEPLIAKLMQPYIDEDTFFSGYTTVDEKEASEAYERKCRADQARRSDESQAAYEENRKKTREIAVKSSWGADWLSKWWYLLLVVVVVGCVKACKMTTPGGKISTQFTSPMSRLPKMPVRNVPSLLPSQQMKISNRSSDKPHKYKLPELPELHKTFKLSKLPKMEMKLVDYKRPEVSKAPEASKTLEVSNDSSSSVPIAPL